MGIEKSSLMIFMGLKEQNLIFLLPPATMTSTAGCSAMLFPGPEQAGLKGIMPDDRGN